MKTVPFPFCSGCALFPCIDLFLQGVQTVDMFAPFETCFFYYLLSKCNILSSAVCDIGSASFKYDMRRLSEILAFPRAWYRRSIARRLFLGDQTINLPGDFKHSAA